MKTAKPYLLLLSAAWMAASAVSHAAEALAPAKPKSPAQLRARSFHRTDLNGDGLITRGEFAEANHLSAATPTSDRDFRATRLLRAFHEMDRNADGRVSGKEYLSFMEKNGG